MCEDSGYVSSFSSYSGTTMWQENNKTIKSQEQRGKWEDSGETFCLIITFHIKPCLVLTGICCVATFRELGTIIFNACFNNLLLDLHWNIECMDSCDSTLERGSSFSKFEKL